MICRAPQVVKERTATPQFPSQLRHASTASVSGEAPAQAASRTGLRAALGFALLSITYTLGVLYPPDLYTLVYPREAPPSPEKGSKEALRAAAELEKQLWQIPLVRELAQKSYPLNADTVPAQFLGPKDIAGVNSRKNLNASTTDNPGTEVPTHYMVRPYLNLSESFSRHSFTAGLMQGPGKMAIPPLLFIETNEKALTGVIHLGRSICGHDGIVHGGAIATMFDDAFFRTGVMSFPAKIGVTAWLRIEYKAPTRADQFVVFKTKVDKAEGRKVFLSGHMEDLEGNLLVKAEALFVQPKYAHLVQSEERAKHYLNRPAAIANTVEPVSESSDMK
ncbi:hypothetical protein PIIN_09635 [Serendipita indica DSM 11827]|uniref:Thioesterase domain-containing protein n=1 Tax=Serendipita indica (strain DSM 11827) TaxID=1109443 RepID=G4TWF1_SERID|nr:hypothetical protein PIIN_09635 [Serendipita indica DSM 11827]